MNMLIPQIPVGMVVVAVKSPNDIEQTHRQLNDAGLKNSRQTKLLGIVIGEFEGDENNFLSVPNVKSVRRVTAEQ